MRTWYQRWHLMVLAALLCTVLLIPLAASAQTTTPVGLKYTETLHFSIKDGIAQANQPLPDDETVYTGKDGLVRPMSLDWHPNGTDLAVGYLDGWYRIWNTQTGTVKFQEPVRVDIYSGSTPRKQPQEPIEFYGPRVRYSPDGKLLAVTAWDQLRIYAGASLVQTCKDFGDAPISWSPDGAFIAGISTAQALVICDTRTGVNQSLRRRLVITGVEWSPDGRYLLLSTDDFDFTSYIRLLNVSTGEIENTVIGKYGATWRPDGTAFVSAGWTWLRDTQTGFPRILLDESGKAVAWHPSGQRIAILADSRVAITSAATGSIIAAIPSNTRPYIGFTSQQGQMAWSRDGRYLAASDFPKAVHIWKETGVQPPLPPPTNTPRAISISSTWTPVPPTPTLAALVRPPVQKVIRLGNSQDTPWMTPAPNGLPIQLTHGRFMAIFNEQQRSIVIQNLDYPSLKLVFPDTAIFEPDLRKLRWSPNGRYLAIIRDKVNIDVYDLQTLKLVDTIYHPDQVTWVTWSTDSQHLASFSTLVPITNSPEILIVRDVKTQKQKQWTDLFRGYSPQLYWIGSTTLLFVGQDAGIFYLDTESGKINTIQPSNKTITIAGISADLRYIAWSFWGGSEGISDTIQILDMQTRKVVQTLPANGRVIGIEWSPDGTQLATHYDEDG